MYVVRPGIDFTSSTFVRSRASHEAGSNGRLSQKKKESGRDCVDTNCADVCSIQPRTDCGVLDRILVMLLLSTHTSMLAWRYPSIL